MTRGTAARSSGGERHYPVLPDDSGKSRHTGEGVTSNNHQGAFTSFLSYWVAWLFVIIVMLSSFPALTRAQAVWGSIQGYVTDPSGGAVPKATVRATEERTGVVTQAVTSSLGLYNITHIIPGTYSVSVESSGFRRFVQSGVLLTVGATVRLDVKLVLGSVQQTIRVTGASPILNTQHTEVSTGFTSGQVEALPIMQNNVTYLGDLVPGVVKDTFQMGVGENPQQTDRVMVNGTFSGAQVYTLDGITDVDYGFSGIQVINPPQDSVQEVKVATSSYDTEFGSTAGMVMQYVTKPGTNQLHGSAFEYNQNSGTFAADPFTEKIAGTGPNGKGIGVQPFNWNEFGGSLGGPIKKNKVFMFGDYEGTRTVATTGMVATVPNAAWRSGDLSSDEATNPIYDPATGTSSGTGRSPFPGNVIPSSMISPVAAKLMGLLPLPNVNQTPNNNYDGAIREVFNSNGFDLRNDWNVSDKDRFFVTYHYYKTFLNNPPLFGVPADGPTTGGLSPELANTLSQQSAANWTHTFGPTLTTEFRAGFDRFHIAGYQSDSTTATDNAVGITGINNPSNPLTMGLAGMTINGPDGAWTMGIDSGVGIPRFEGSTTYEIVNNWMKMQGSHQFQWGFDLQRQDFNFLSVNDSSRGNFTFSNSITASPNVANSGLGMASFLLGDPSEYDMALYTSFPGERQTRVGIYGQDIWHVTPKLTARIGLRWDKITPVTPAHPGGIADFDPATGDILLGGLGKNSASDNITSPDTDFGPRVGLAYRITNRTVIRAGFSTSYFASGYDADFYHLTSFYPITAQPDVTQVNEFTPVFPLGPPPASVTALPPPLPSSGVVPAPNGTTLKSRPFNWLTETMYSDNVTLEQQLTPNTTLSVAYVGTAASHLDWGYNMNAAGPGPGAVQSRRPFYNLYGLSQSISMLCNCNTMNYNSLQISLTKRYSHDFSVMSNFTWDKELGYYSQFPVAYRNLDYGPGGGFESTGVSNARGAVFNVEEILRLPFGPGQRFGSSAGGVENAFLGGWQFSGTQSAGSGLYLTPTMSNSAPLNADFGNLANRVSGCNPYNVPGGQSFSNWYNRACFSAPGPFQIGDASPGMLTGPGMFTADLSLWKTWSFKTPLSRESTSLEFRFDAFNATNYTNAATPSGSQFSANVNTDSPTGATITALEAGYNMRELQFGLHLSW
jgi:hypothetical protein